MTDFNNNRLTKTDFLLYCEAPRHLWAKKHNQIEQTLSDFDRHLIDEGYAVESLAREYLETIFLTDHPRADLFWQQAFTSGPFEARTDALIYWPDEEIYDLYEIKSKTKPDKDDFIDIAYQAMVLKDQLHLGRCVLLHLNKEYIRSEHNDLSQLFTADDVTERVETLLPEIASMSQDALYAIGTNDPSSLAFCLTPKECPCPAVCHPKLPNFSIYDIPYLGARKKIELLDMGIREASQIPATFALNEKQRRIAERSRTHTEFIDKAALKSELDRLQFPLWFLDYETCIMAVPRFAGYHPQQQAVFQFSLHRLDAPAGNLQHTSYIAIQPGEPSRPLLEHLATHLGESGTVIVWNKTFEMTMNREMAKLFPEYAAFLENVNARIYDLGEIVNQGIYLHPGFKGSWSIKNVLPVMVPELSYRDLPINKGDQASIAWWNLAFGDTPEPEKQRLVEHLGNYCALDTLAMVELYHKFRSLL